MHCAMYIRNLCGVMAFQRSVLDWRRQWGQPAIGICALCYIYQKLLSSNCFQKIYAQLDEGVGSICHGILLYVKLLCCMGLPWVYVHYALCETYGV